MLRSFVLMLILLTEMRLLAINGPDFKKTTEHDKLKKTIYDSFLETNERGTYWDQLRRISTARKFWMKKLESSFFQYFQANQNLIRMPIAYLAFPVMLRFQILHSIPAIDWTLIDDQGSLESLWSYRIIMGQAQFLKLTNRGLDKINGRELLESWSGYSIPLSDQFGVYSIDPLLERGTIRFFQISEPLVLWLLQQEASSIELSNLFRRSIEIYKNPIVALSVIAQLFDLERHFCGWHRTHNCFLAHRVRPIFNRINDHVGINYHFWATLNLALTEPYSKFMDFGSFVIERVRQNDEEDYQADLLGLKLGREIRSDLERLVVLGLQLPVNH